MAAGMLCCMNAMGLRGLGRCKIDPMCRMFPKLQLGCRTSVSLTHVRFI